MLRNKPFYYSRAIPVLAAGMIGYLIGGWHPATSRDGSALSATESVALRFPQDWIEGRADANTPAAGLLSAATATTGTSDAELALLSPEPMVRRPDPPAAAQSSQLTPQVAPATPAALPEPRLQLAAAEEVVPRRMVAPSPAVAAAPVHVIKAPAVAAIHHPPMNRPGYMLDDAQIASIKERLHLTPDQEQMWPAVEAALRNIAYEREQQARGRGIRAERTQTAEVDPQSVEGLKSAAVPLIMSFNDEQKQEVRNLAHVMGLDQLASEF
jgi:hypothetical protein